MTPSTTAAVPRGCAVVIPARNEAGAIARVVARIPRDLGAEVIVVDNGSRDGTGEAARMAGARVVVEPRRGYGEACCAGAAAAAGAAIIVFIDGDGSMDPGEIPRLIAPIVADEADIVCGSRSHADPASLPLHQRIGNRLAVGLLRVLYGVRLSELGPYRAVRAATLAELGLRGSRYAWVAELLARAARRGARITEVEVSYRHRTAGRSKVGGTIRGSLGAGLAIVGTLLWRRVAPW